MESKRKACFACIEIKQRCSFANHRGTSGPVLDVAIGTLGTDLCAALESLGDEMREATYATLSVDLWQTRASLHQANLLALDLQWKVIEAQSRGVQVPEGCRRAMDRGVTRTRALQLATAVEHADVAGVPQDSVNSTMGLINRRWAVPLTVDVRGPSKFPSSDPPIPAP